jgi:hypothetical protein
MTILFIVISECFYQESTVFKNIDTRLKISGMTERGTSPLNAFITPSFLSSQGLRKMLFLPQWFFFLCFSSSFIFTYALFRRFVFRGIIKGVPLLLLCGDLALEFSPMRKVRLAINTKRITFSSLKVPRDITARKNFLESGS